MNSIFKKVLNKSSCLRPSNFYANYSVKYFSQIKKIEAKIKDSKIAMPNTQTKKIATIITPAKPTAHKTDVKKDTKAPTKSAEIKAMKSEDKPKTKTATKTISKPKVKAALNTTTKPKTSSTKKSASSKSKVNTFAVKEISQKYLGKGLANNDNIVIHHCDLKSENPFKDYINSEYMCSKSKEFVIKERDVLCYNYAPLPVVLSKAKGCIVQDVAGRNYIDFLSAYSAVNQGHGNQEIIKAATSQMNILYLTSRAFYNQYLYSAALNITKLFNYDKVLFMNGGVEAVESAIKIARKWGYTKKGIKDNHARIIFAKGNFHGRTMTVCAGSDDASRTSHFGPFGDQKFEIIEYNNIQVLKDTLESSNEYCAVLFEPIQGEHGVVIPSDDYMKQVRELCTKHNVLMISDEIQTGFGRTGTLLRTDIYSIKPDMVLLGKSLSGGIYPVSAVLANKEIMDVLQPGSHGSTYGGNPLAMTIVNSAINEITKNGFAMLKNCQKRGDELGLYLLHKTRTNRFIKEIRGRGLMCGVELHKDAPVNVYEVCVMLMERGLLCKPTGKSVLRLSPPLTLSEEELWGSCQIINDLFESLEAKFPEYHSVGETHFDFKPPSPEAIIQLQQRRSSLSSGKKISPVSKSHKAAEKSTIVDQPSEHKIFH